MITGVNLGNWLVLEKWMSPELFAGTDAEDETHLCEQLDEVAKRERFKVHRDSYVTERDFAYLASRGIDAVRIPVPFFIFGDYPPYVGCLEYLDQAFDWAQKFGLQVLVELHTVPDSQNGFDNGGLCGVCRWHKNPSYVECALEVLEKLTVRYRDHSALWGIGVLNEPISPELWTQLDIPNRYPALDPEAAADSEPVPTEFLKEFYRRAYRRIRAQSDDVRIVFHDGFRIKEWVGYFDSPEFERIVIDTHQYLMVHTWTAGETDLDGYLAYIRDELAALVTEMSPHFPIIIGEWCLSSMSPAVAALPEAERRDFYRAVAAAQLEAWARAEGWFFWNYKLLVAGSDLDGWDLGKSLDLGYFGEAL